MATATTDRYPKIGHAPAAVADLFASLYLDAHSVPPEEMPSGAPVMQVSTRDHAGQAAPSGRPEALRDPLGRLHQQARV